MIGCLWVRLLDGKKNKGIDKSQLFDVGVARDDAHGFSCDKDA